MVDEHFVLRRPSGFRGNVRRIAAGKERGDFQARTAVSERPAGRPDDTSSSRCHNGVAGRHVPVVRWPEPRIEVGAAFGHPAEFNC